MPTHDSTTDERSYFRQLQDGLTTSFNRSLSEYSALRPHIERLATQNAAHRGALIEGSVSLVTNRVEAVMAVYRSPSAFYRSAVSGFQWASYFARGDDLNRDVHQAGTEAIYSHIKAPSLRGVATIAWTQIDLARGGARELEAHARTRYEQQRNALVVSSGLGFGVTQLLKRAGTLVQTDIQRLMVRSALRTWQVTGLMGLCYGLSRLNSSIEESGVFGAQLRQRRDAYLATRPTSSRSELEDSILSIIEREA